MSFYRATRSADASGGVTRTVPATATIPSVLCAAQPLKSDEIFDYARRQIEADVAVYSVFNFDSDPRSPGGVKLGDQFKDAATGFVYVVKAVERDYNSMISSLPLYKIACKRLIV